ncbi:MAG: ATP-binding protein [Treponema sp.]|nr:ATP-binding protein [Treponema sp.]
MFINREDYVDMVRPFYETDLIKVITGIRRSGKSVILQAIRDEFLHNGINGDQIIFINLEDFEYEFIKTAADLHKEIKNRITSDQKYYIFIDEVQNVKDFEKVLASLRATLKTSIFVTGSNSTLLSGELASLLVGRTVEFEIMPFSFSEVKEYFRVNNREFTEDMIFDYIKWGGFPLRFDFHREQDIRRYLLSLYEGIIKKDIAGKSSKFDKKTFMDISLYILANAGKEFSSENVINYYKTHHKKSITRQTVYNYLEKMQKAFLVHGVKKYNIVGKEALKANEKYYAVDMGLRIINTNSINFEDTFFLENVIYNELILRGYTVYTGKTYKGEIDFVAIKDGKKCFIQVCYLLASAETIAREFGAFKPISDASPKYVMSLDKIDMSRDGIGHINIVDFLLRKADIALT